MKNILFIFLAFICSLGVSAQNSSNNKLVAYFSCSGITKAAAQKIADAVNADIYEIKPTVAYTEADLDYRNMQSRSSIEMKDKASRPAIKGNVSNINKYNVVYIGFPVWWNLAPRIINTFIEKNKLKGKKVVLFATSGSSPIDNCEKVMHSTYKDINWIPGKLIKKDMDKSAISQWAKSIK